MLIREARISDIRGLARAHLDSWKSAYRGLVPDDVLDGRTYETVETRWQKRLTQPEPESFSFVAETDSGEIVGFASGGPPQHETTSFKGELRAIYILKEYQGIGVGRQLVVAVARRLHEGGLEPMLLWVFEQNPAARGFYERLGGRLTGESKNLNIGGKDLIEVAYGWDDLSIFLD